GYVLFPSDDTNYPSGTTWTTARGRMTFNSGLLTITKTGSGSGTWTQGTTGQSTAVLTLQTDGNLVIYPQATHTGAIWASGTYFNANDAMFFQPDGNLVIYKYDGTAIWASGTNN